MYRAIYFKQMNLYILLVFCSLLTCIYKVNANEKSFNKLSCNGDVKESTCKDKQVKSGISIEAPTLPTNQPIKIEVIPYLKD